MVFIWNVMNDSLSLMHYKHSIFFFFFWVQKSWLCWRNEAARCPKIDKLKSLRQAGGHELCLVLYFLIWSSLDAAAHWNGGSFNHNAFHFWETGNLSALTFIYLNFFPYIDLTHWPPNLHATTSQLNLHYSQQCHILYLAANFNTTLTHSLTPLHTLQFRGDTVLL